LSRDVVFHEYIYPFAHKGKGKSQDVKNNPAIWDNFPDLDGFNPDHFVPATVGAETQTCEPPGLETNEPLVAQTASTGRGSNELEGPSSGYVQPSTENAQLSLRNGPRRGDRLRRAPIHLSDYLCYGATPQDPSLTNNSKKSSSICGPVSHNNFSEKSYHNLNLEIIGKLRLDCK